MAEVTESDAPAGGKAAMLTDTDIRNVSGVPDLKILRYPELKNFRTWNDLLSNKGKAAAVLFLTENDTTGHWLAVFDGPAQTAVVFDPLGLGVDAERKMLTPQKNEELGQSEPELARLLVTAEQAGKRPAVNHTDFQEFKASVNTCGRWTALRIAKRHLTPAEFSSFVRESMRADGCKNADDWVTRVTSGEGAEGKAASDESSAESTAAVAPESEGVQSLIGAGKLAGTKRGRGLAGAGKWPAFRKSQASAGNRTRSLADMDEEQRLLVNEHINEENALIRKWNALKVKARRLQDDLTNGRVSWAEHDRLDARLSARLEEVQLMIDNAREIRMHIQDKYLARFPAHPDFPIERLGLGYEGAENKDDDTGAGFCGGSAPQLRGGILKPEYQSLQDLLRGYSVNTQDAVVEALMALDIDSNLWDELIREPRFVRLLPDAHIPGTLEAQRAPTPPLFEDAPDSRLVVDAAGAPVDFAGEAAGPPASATALERSMFNNGQQMRRAQLQMYAAENKPDGDERTAEIAALEQRIAYLRYEWDQLTAQQARLHDLHGGGPPTLSGGTTVCGGSIAAWGAQLADFFAESGGAPLSGGGKFSIARARQIHGPSAYDSAYTDWRKKYDKSEDELARTLDAATKAERTYRTELETMEPDNLDRLRHVTNEYFDAQHRIAGLPNLKLVDNGRHFLRQYRHERLVGYPSASEHAAAYRGEEPAFPRTHPERQRASAYVMSAPHPDARYDELKANFERARGLSNRVRTAEAYHAYRQAELQFDRYKAYLEAEERRHGPGELEGSGPMPPEGDLQPLARASYQKTPPHQVGSYTLVYETPTLKFYKSDVTNTIIAAIRGTADARDVSAWAPVAMNTLDKTARWQEDNETFQKVQEQYPQSEFDYYAVGHSLGGAIADLALKNGYVKEALSFNAAVQRADLGNANAKHKRIYAHSDLLGKLGSWFGLKGDTETRTVAADTPLAGHALSNFDAADANPEHAQPYQPPEPAAASASTVAAMAAGARQPGRGRLMQG